MRAVDGRKYAQALRLKKASLPLAELLIST
jgi:hypothetical protein